MNGLLNNACSLMAPAMQTRHGGEPWRVLVVEDDGAQAALLAHNGVSVCCVGAEAAWRALRSGHWHAVLVDLGAADEARFALLAHARAVDATLRILACSAYANVAMAVRAIRLGADDCLVKPAPGATLLRALGVGVAPCAAVPAITAPMVPQQLEWEHIQRVLEQQDGNVSATARALHMHRRTLQRKLARCATTRQRCAV